MKCTLIKTNESMYFRMYPNLFNGVISLTWSSSVYYNTYEKFKEYYQYHDSIKIVEGHDFNEPKNGEIVIQFFYNKAGKQMVKIIVCNGNINNAKLYLERIVKFLWAKLDIEKDIQLARKRNLRSLPF